MTVVTRRAGIVVIGIACLGLLALAAGAAERRSGRVVAVDAGAGTIVIDEVGPWQVKHGVTQVMRHSIVVSPTAKIVSHIRVNVPGRYEGDFIDVPLELDDVARGDFVTVGCWREGERLVATSIEVAELESETASP